MASRRDIIARAIGAGFIGLGGRFANAQTATFEQLLRRVRDDEILREKVRPLGEGQRELYEYHFTKAIAPRNPPSPVPVSEATVQLISSFEIGDKIRFKEGAVWPGGKSGVTIGIGYDLGYVTKRWLNEDWGDRLDQPTMAVLESVCGITGQKARQALATLSPITIPWTTADAQFRKYLLPRYVAETLARLPNAKQLRPDCLGALTSLVYNRGASFMKDGDQYREMRKIRDLMVAGEYRAVPEQIRSMKRIWRGQGLDGLLVRREMEALLFEKGLAS